MAFPWRRRRFDLAVLHRRRGKADRQKHETEKGKAPFHVAATIFVVRGKGEDRDGGHDRASLQEWMNLFWLLTNGPRDKTDKVKRFLKMAFSKKIRIKYRDKFGKIEK